MKNEIKKQIEDLDNIWIDIIDMDDRISELDREIKIYIGEEKYDRVYQCEAEKSRLMTRIEYLRSRSNVLERLIMTMMLEE